MSEPGTSGEDDPLERGIRSWLAREGYSIEFSAARVLGSSGFAVEWGRRYEDVQSREWRSSDLVALQVSRSGVALQLAVECKYASQPWLVLETSLGTPGLDVLGSALSENHRNRFKWLFPEPSIDGFEVLSAYVVKADEPAPKKASGKDPAHEAVYQAWKAAYWLHSNREILQRGHRPIATVPMVVTNGQPLFTLSYRPSGEPDLRRVGWSHIAFWSPVLANPTVVPIVTLDAFEAYVEGMTKTFLREFGALRQVE